MSKKIIVEENVTYNTKTGAMKIFESDGQTNHYAVLVKAGHCGDGYYIPLVIGVSATSQALAVEIARHKSRIKTTRSGAVMDIIKIRLK